MLFILCKVKVLFKNRYAGLIALIVILLGVNLFGGLWMLSYNSDDAPPLPTLATLPDFESATLYTLSDIPEGYTPPTPFYAVEAEVWEQEIVSANIEQVTREAEIRDSAIAGQVILEFADTMTSDEIATYLETLDVEVLETITQLNRVVILSEAETIKTIQSSSLITSEPDYYASALLTMPTTDPYYDLQWNLQAVGAPDLWDGLSDGFEPITVAVIDSGVCFSHPDMQADYSDFQYDYVDADEIPEDVYGHGCSVTGVIASQNNTIGTLGLAPFIEIMPLRVLDENGIGSYSNIARAIIDASNNGADVINLSLGGLQPSQTLQSAVDYALEQGVILVAAGGNSGQQTPLYPARYEGVVSVGAVNQQGEVSSFNHLGVDIYAPGEGVIVPSINGDTAVSSGSSLASPHVAGVIALKLMLGQTFSITDAVLVAPPIPVIEDLSDEDLSKPLQIGDILIPREFVTELDEGSGQFTFGFYAFSWPDGKVYYAFDGAVTAENRQRTRVAMDIWEAAANVEFIPRTNQRDYIYIQNSNGNSSFVGPIGGGQDFNMYNWESRYVIVHELGHALGMWHEQSRGDRDDYVTIDYSQMSSHPNVVGNFEKLPFAYTVGEYDFASVMHYFSTAFSNTGNPTIIVKSPWNTIWQDRIGQSAYMSEWDVLGMWVEYPCAGYTFDCVTIPDNDIFEEAELVDGLSYNHSITGGYGTDLATTAVDDPFPSCAFDDSGKTLWYKFSLPASSVTVSTVGSNYDTLIGVYTGTRGNLTQIACNSDANDSLTSELTFIPVEGEDYYIQVAGELWFGVEEAGGGDLYLSIEAIPVCYLWGDPIAGIPACPPITPDNLYAERVDYVNQIDLSWRDNSTSETEFRIERSLSGADTWSQIDTVVTDETNYSDTTVACYTTYDYRVIAYRLDDGQLSDPSNIATAQSSCIDVTPPSNLLEVSSLNDIQLGWTDNAPDETSFSIERSPSGLDTWAEVGTAIANATNYTDNSGLTCGFDYDYRVLTYREGDTKYSLPSDPITITLTCDPPTAPSNISVDDVITTRNLAIEWQDNSIETGFTVQREVSGTWQNAGTVAADVTTFTDTDNTLACYTEYDYRAKATRSTDSKESTYSVVGSGSTSCDILLAPDNLNVTSSLNTIELAWNNNSPDGTRFDIQRSPTGADTWTDMGTSTITSYSDATATCGYTYDYQVRQYRDDDGIYSPYSALTTATQTCSPPTTPDTFNATAVPFTNDFALTWQDNAFNETDYRVERWDDDGSTWEEIAVLAANTTSYTDSDVDLDCYTSYDYRVRAYRNTDAVFSSYSATDSDTSWCDPILITAQNFGDSQMTGDASGVNGFPYASCAPNVTHVRVWEYTPAANQHFSIDTFDSGMDTALSIINYNGSFVPVGCNDNGTTDGTSAVYVDLVAGQRYMIIAGGKNGVAGTIDLRLRRILPPTPTLVPTVTPLPSPTSSPNLTTIGLFNDGVWSFRDNNSSGTSDFTIRYGETLSDEWQPVIGDWNGDGTDGLGLYRNGQWLLRDIDGNAVTTPYDFTFGFRESGWQPVIGDWNGDGKDGVGLYKDGQWILKNNLSSGASDYSFRFSFPNNPSGYAIAGDWHDQSADRVGIYDKGRWLLAFDHRTGTKATLVNFGSSNGGWYPVVGDFDQDGDDTIGIYKDGQWLLRNSNASGSPDFNFTFRSGNAKPVSSYRGGASALTILANAPDINTVVTSPSNTLVPKAIISTAEPTGTPLPTSTPEPSVTFTPLPTLTPEPSATDTPIPTMTPQPTATEEEVVIPDNVSSTSP